MHVSRNQVGRPQVSLLEPGVHKVGNFGKASCCRKCPENTTRYMYPSKIEWDLTNGPLSKLESY